MKGWMWIILIVVIAVVCNVSKSEPQPSVTSHTDWKTLAVASQTRSSDSDLGEAGEKVFEAESHSKYEDENDKGSDIDWITEFTSEAPKERPWEALGIKTVSSDETVSHPCLIKGNVSYDTGEKIYHLPGCRSYDKTIINPRYGERWFCTETEAQAAGWRKAKDCKGY